jgi:osmotically-inducible protein OsmY
MKSDSEIERDVRDELKWDPDLDASDIAVSVKGGVVTLAGFTHSYADRLEAESAAKRVTGVRAIANDIEVRLPSIDQRPDPDIARDAITALKSELPISHDKIKATVKDGWITLEGSAEWQYQKTAAENAVRKIQGVNHQRDHGQSKSPALRAEAEDSGRLQAKRRSRRQPDRGRG